jgi:hypothetical protein
MGFDVFSAGVFLCISFALVGGRYDNGLSAGLWYWNCWDTSSVANTNIGARLIIFKIHIKGFGVLARS